jgi:hypothetical protein
MSGPPADQPYTWTDPATGTTYYLQAGRYYDVSGRPYVAPAAPAAPDPYQNWQSSDAGGRSWRYIGDTDKTFYEDNPSQLYQQYLTDEFGGRQTPLAQYAGNQYGRYYADYLKWSEGDKSGQRMFGDTLTNNLAQQIRNSFSLQSPTQKGYNLMFQPSGRMTGP